MADETKVIRIVIDSSKAVDGGREAQRALENIEKATSKTETTLARLEKTVSSAALILKAQLVAILYDVAMRLKEMAVQALEAVSGLDELADQLGITVAGLQALQYSAVQNGVKLEQLEGGIGKFSQKIGEAANGSKEMLSALDSIGVKILDLHGKLRPTEELMQEVAAAIIAIDDPAKRAAASVDFFGKTGMKFQPMLQDMAKGFGYMGEQARVGGAMVDEHVRKRLDEMADAAERSKLKLRQFFAETVVAALDAADSFKEFAKKNQEGSKESELAFRNWMDNTLSSMAGVAAGVVEVFRGAVVQVHKVWVDGFNDILAAAEQWANSMATIKKPSWFGSGEIKLMDPVSIPRVPGGGASAQDYLTGIGNAANTARNEAQAYYARQRAAQDGSGGSAGYGGSEPPPGTVRTTGGGARNPPPAGGGGGNSETPEQKLAKLEQQLKNTAEAQNSMTAAARAGDQAFEEQKTSLDATQKLFDIFGVTLDKTDERFIRVRDRMREIAQGKVAEQFNVATTELEKQNVVLEAEIRLLNELPEVRAKELAIIKATQEAKKAGSALSAEDIESRRQAIEQNEKLKSQQEELKKSAELWTEPLKQALRDIQSIGADAFDKLLESGKFSFEELQQTFMRIVRRMAAEFLALATIRPVMSVLVNAVSPSMAQSMGLGGGSSPMGGGGFLGGGGGGGLSMPSWLGGGSLSGWLNSPISFGGGLNTSASSPASMMAPTGASGAALGGITWGQGLGALAGAGMGVYQLAAGNGSASSTIGGISSILGAGLSLIPGIGPILGPAVGMLGNLLPGLFGMDKPPTITNQTYGQLTYGSGGWYTTGGAWGPNANSSQAESGLKSLGGSISNVFDLLGGVKDPQKVWGLSAQSKSVSGQGWSSDSTSTFLVDPSGNQQLWRMNESNMMDTASAQVAYRSILEGAVGDITENMRKALIQTGQTMGGTSLQAIAETVSEVLAFDEAIKGLGKTVIDAEKAVKAVDDSFAALYATADKYGLATGDLDASKAAARLGVATDFGKGISRSILEMTDPKAAALADLDDWRSMMVDNNKWLLDNVEGAMDQILKIEELFGLKRAAIIEQTTSNALGSLKSTLDRLLYGDLSGASPGDALSGAYGTYQADLAKANLGDAAAAGRLNSSSADYMSAAASYYGTASAAYQGLRKQTIIDVASAYRYNGGSFGDIPGGYDVIMGGGGFTGLPGMGAGSLNIGLGTVSTQLGELVATITSSNANDEELKQLMKDLLDKMTRLVLGNAG